MQKFVYGFTIIKGRSYSLRFFRRRKFPLSAAENVFRCRKISAAEIRALSILAAEFFGSGKSFPLPKIPRRCSYFSAQLRFPLLDAVHIPTFYPNILRPFSSSERASTHLVRKEHQLHSDFRPWSLPSSSSALVSETHAGIQLQFRRRKATARSVSHVPQDKKRERSIGLSTRPFTALSR